MSSVGRQPDPAAPRRREANIAWKKQRRACARPSPQLRVRSGFTLIEILVSISIIAILIALTSSSLQMAMGAARGFKCQVRLRDIAFDFATYGDPAMGADRGNDANLSGDRFSVATFQEKIFGVDEFWRWGQGNRRVEVSGNHADLERVRCTEVSGDYTLWAGAPAGGGAITPQPSVSFAFNERLHRATQPDQFGFPRPKILSLTPDVLDMPMVPLAWDGDGEAARRLRVYAEFSAPGLAARSPGERREFLFDKGRRWFPSHRHNGVMNVAFIGGHVLSTQRPLEESSWRWEYAPRP